MKPREGPAGMGIVVTAGCQSPPRCSLSPVLLLEGDEDTPGGLCLRRGGEAQRGEGRAQRPRSLGTLEPMPPWAGSLDRGSACFLERLITGAMGPIRSVPCSKWSSLIHWVSARKGWWITSIYSPGFCSRTVLPITGWPRCSRGAGRGACDRKPLAAVPGGSWLPPRDSTSFQPLSQFRFRLGIIWG